MTALLISNASRGQPIAKISQPIGGQLAAEKPTKCSDFGIILPLMHPSPGQSIATSIQRQYLTSAAAINAQSCGNDVHAVMNILLLSTSNGMHFDHVST
jgi:hypothetical protein